MRTRIVVAFDLVVIAAALAWLFAGCGSPSSAASMSGHYAYAMTYADGGPVDLCPGKAPLAGALDLLADGGVRWTACSQEFSGRADVLAADQLSLLLDVQDSWGGFLADVRYSAGGLYGPVVGRGVEGVFSAVREGARRGKVLDSATERQ